MTDPGVQLAARASWEVGQRRAWFGQACARADAESEAVERAEAERASNAADEAEFAAWRRTLTGEPVLTVSAVLERSRMAVDAPQRDLSAPLGSAERPALRVGDVWVDPELRQAQRSDSELVLEQARRMAADPYMAVMVKRYGHRGGRGEVSRSTPTGEVFCLDCQKYGFSAEESILVHAMPDSPAPRTVPDSEPEHSARYVSSGLGWPGEIVR